MSHGGVWKVGEPSCGCSERQSLLLYHPVNQRSARKVCWKMFSLLARAQDSDEDGVSRFGLSECDDIVMHRA